MANEIKVRYRVWSTNLQDGSVLSKMRTMYPKGANPEKLPFLPAQKHIVPVAGGKLANAGIKEFGTFFMKSGKKVPYIVSVKGESVSGANVVRAIFRSIMKFGMKLV